MEPLVRRRVRNRIAAIMAHTDRYVFRGQARLALDAGVTQSTVSRFLAGQCNPSFALVVALANALEEHLGHHVDVRELVSMDGTFPTPSVCELCGCPGCLPPQVYDEDDQVKPDYRHLQAGHWQLVADTKEGKTLSETKEEE